ncbi:hypothetical protein HSIEG1_1326 [Enterococcus sp. HSIEG1]|nr:hypothetical protein HSIEG1_1326 [Enterococcus sp. HSIEG1]
MEENSNAKTVVMTAITAELPKAQVKFSSEANKFWKLITS